jgi:hypothetical protein
MWSGRQLAAIGAGALAAESAHPLAGMHVQHGRAGPDDFPASPAFVAWGAEAIAAARGRR